MPVVARKAGVRLDGWRRTATVPFSPARRHMVTVHTDGSSGRVLVTNRWIVWGIAVQVAGQLALTYLAAMNHLFQTAPIDGGSGLRILALAATAWVVVTVDKRLRPPVL